MAGRGLKVNFLHKLKKKKKATVADTFLLPEDKKEIEQLVEVQEEYEKGIDKINNEILTIQESTHTLMPKFSRLHHQLRQKFRWYYRWHTKKYAHIVHWVILFLYLCALPAVFHSAFQSPQVTKAAPIDCKWTNNSGDGKWSTVTNWDCGGHIPDNGSNVILDTTSNTAITIDVAATAGSFTINTGYTKTVTANFGLTLDTTQGGTGDFKILTAAIYLAKTTNITVPGNWDTSVGPFSSGTSTVIFNGTDPGKTINSGASRFYNITFDGPGGVWSPLINNVNINNNLTMTAGTFDNSNGLGNVSVSNNVTGTNGVISFTANTFTHSPYMIKNFGTTSSANVWTFNNLNFEESGPSASTIDISGGGTGKIIVTNTLTIGNATQIYTATVNNETNDRILEIANINITSKGIFTASSSASFTVSGNWTNAGTFTSGSGTVTFNRATTTQTLNSGGTAAAKTFKNLTHSGTGTLQLLSNTLNIDGNFTNSAGTFDVNSKDMTVAGNFNNTDGIFLSGTCTVTLDGSTLQTVTAGGTDSNHYLYNLIVANTSGVGPGAGVTFADSLSLATGGTFADTTGDSKLIFNAGSNYIFPKLNLNGTSGQTIQLRSSGDSAWNLYTDANSIVRFIDVAYSKANNVIDDTDGGINSFNNTNWLFNIPVDPSVVAPTIGSPEVISATAIRWHFQDNTENETGFKVYNSSGDIVATCNDLDLHYCDETGLSPNQQYSRKVVAFNASFRSDFSAIATSPYTWANPPAISTVANPTLSTLDMTLAPNSNPASTEFAFGIDNDDNGSIDTNGWVQADGYLGASAVWQTDVNWHIWHVVPKTVSGLSPNTKYIFKSKARNYIGTETVLSPGSSKYTLIEYPGNITVDNVTSSTMTMHINNTLSNLNLDLSGLYFSVHSPGGASAGSSFDQWTQATTVTATGLMPDYAYDFWVRERNGDGIETMGLGYSDYPIYTKANTPLAPTVTNVSDRGDQLSVSISDGDSNQSWTTYAIYESTQGKYVQADGSFGDSAVWLSKAQWGTKTVSGLTEETTYTFQAKALNHDGIETVFSPSSSKNTGVTESASVSSPANLRATLIQSTRIDLAWNGGGDGVIGYKLYNNDTGVRIATTTDTSQSLTNLSPDTTYHFYVRAYDSSGINSYKSEILTVTTLGSASSANPSATFLVLSNTPNEVTSGKAFSSPVKIMAMDGGGAVIKNYTGKIYFESTDKNADLKWNKDNAYTFVTSDNGTHEFSGSDFVFKTAGNQVLTVTDGTVTGLVEIKVIAGDSIFAKAQEAISDFVNESASKVNAAIDSLQNSVAAQQIAEVAKKVVQSTAALGLIPLIANIVGSAPVAIHAINYGISLTLEALGIRKRRKTWGRVFDSTTGKGVDMALVRLYDQDSMKLVSTIITDIKGKYHFSAEPGVYALSVSKDGYVFPTEIFVKYGITSINKHASRVNNQYIGQPINIDSKNNILNIDVPIDPVKPKISLWIRIKLIGSDIFSYLIMGLPYVVIPTLSLGSLLSIFTAIVKPSWYNIALSIVYIILTAGYIISRIRRSIHQSTVIDRKTKKAISGVMVSLFEKEHNDLRESRITDITGRFSIYAPKGHYYIKAQKNGYKFTFGKDKEDEKNIILKEDSFIKVDITGQHHRS